MTGWAGRTGEGKLQIEAWEWRWGEGQTSLLSGMERPGVLLAPSAGFRLGSRGDSGWARTGGLDMCSLFPDHSAFTFRMVSRNDRKQLNIVLGPEPSREDPSASHRCPSAVVPTASCPVRARARPCSEPVACL